MTATLLEMTDRCLEIAYTHCEMSSHITEVFMVDMFLSFPPKNRYMT